MTKRLMNIDGQSPHTEGIGFHTLPSAEVIGSVERVNGSEAKTCLEFQATRHELNVLAEHWYHVLTDIELFWFLDRTTGSIEWRTATYAARRLRRIRAILGDQSIDEVIARIDAEFAQQLGETVWSQFKAQR